MPDNTSTADVPSAPVLHRYPGRRWLLLGIGVTLLGIAGYIAQMALEQLVTPWYMPVSGTLAVILVAFSLCQARSVWRWLGLVFVLFVAAADWFLILGSRLPEYAGPAEVGKPMPAFQTTRADGTPFTQHDLKGDQNSVLVSFRGRW